jgi:hypothetical protein
MTCPEPTLQPTARHKQQEYVCGFMFSPDHQVVLLVKKNRPDWQAGRYNGAGGNRIAT